MADRQWQEQRQGRKHDMLMKMKVKSLKRHLTLMKCCKRGVCWKRVDMNSGKR